jgi:hypothetical protein
MLVRTITKWNENMQKQSEVDEALTEKLLGVLYKVRGMVADGHIGIVLPFVELGTMDDDSMNKFCAKICGSPIFVSAAETLYKHGFMLSFEIEVEKSRIALVVQVDSSKAVS